ncbi:uncharacterized protein [Linepithema humile]|uniref:uncharacterized protein isoform X1 n=2 Tax=Linepithema humile TaxID=83485 RepID=UPI00351EC899
MILAHRMRQRFKMQNMPYVYLTDIVKQSQYTSNMDRARNSEISMNRRTNKDKWNYLTQNMPYVYLTDIVKQSHYANNEDRARNSEISVNRQTDKACTNLSSSPTQIANNKILRDVINKQTVTNKVNDEKSLKSCHAELICETDKNQPLHFSSVQPSNVHADVVRNYNVHDENISKNAKDALATSLLNCAHDSNETLDSHFMCQDHTCIISTSDVDKRTDNDQTEYAVDKQNELPDKEYNDYHLANYDSFANDIHENAYLYASENTYNVQRIETKDSCNDLQKNCDNLEYLDLTIHKEDSDSEYCPSEHSSILTEVDADKDVFPDGTNGNKRSSGSKRNSKNNSGFEVSVQANESSVLCPDDVDLNIDPSQGPKGGNKKNCCFYCRKMQSKIARHLATVHRNEPEVKKFLDLKPKNLERRRIIETISRNGNFIHNTNSNVNDGKLLVCRRPRENSKKTAKDYTACGKCKGFFVKSSIRRHFHRCTGRSSKQQRSVMVMGRAIIGRINPIAEETLRKVVFPALREDETTRIIRYDELVIMFGNRLCRKYRKQYQHKLIRSHLRYLGRFLKAMRDLNAQVADMKSIYHPAFYEDCIRAVNKMSAFDSSTNTYKVTTTPQLMGTLLKKVGNLLITQCIKKKDYEKKKDTEEFLALLIDDFPTSINKAALEAQEENRRHKKTELPLMDDIIKLRNYLDEKRNIMCAILKETFFYDNWLELSKVTLTSVQLFNRRRAGEIEHLLIKDFENYEQISESTDKDLLQSLSGEAREIAKKYVRFTIRGKLMRTVPVLLSAQLLQCIELILKYRGDARVPAENPYLFGIPGYNKSCFKYLNACELMRRFSTECGAQRPWTLRGTSLRKHVATISVALDLSENDVSDLAKHMGHALAIHKEIYRQPIISRDIVRMSQVLEKAQGVSSDESDETNSIYENNGEHSTNDINLSNEIDAMDTSPYNTTNDSIPSMNVKSTRKSAKKRNTPPYGRTRRVRWTEEEKQIVMEHFGDCITDAKLPSIKAIQEVIARNPCLQNRSASVVKTWINNQQKINVRRNV